MKDRLEGGCGQVEEGYGPRPIGGEVFVKVGEVAAIYENGIKLVLSLKVGEKLEDRDSYMCTTYHFRSPTYAIRQPNPVRYQDNGNRHWR